MKILIISLIAKTIALVSRLFGLGAGVTWPGEISLLLDKNIFPKLIKDLRKGVILVAGTNGKTTTALMIKDILAKNNASVILNQTGANLKNGIIGALILRTNWQGKLDADHGIFEVDEATLPLILQEITPKIIVLLNLFRDQLDRYGEVDSIAQKWSKALRENETLLIANADDPLIAYIGENYRGPKQYFGLEDDKYNLGKLSHATDSTYCLYCGKKLDFRKVFLSHYGDWQCLGCQKERPKLNLSKAMSPLTGVYNLYNTLAAVLTTISLGVPQKTIDAALESFEPAFGRQEQFQKNGKKIQIFLSKNPAGFNESIRTVLENKDSGQVIFALNDRIPDGTDVSWIWDVDFEEIVKKAKTIICSGDRVYDMALRIKYSFQTQNSKLKTFDKLEGALRHGLENTLKEETLYIFPTYSAMLDIRKILTGKKIL